MNICTITVCRRPQQRVSPILVMLMSYSDFNCEGSNISFKESKLDDIDLNSNSFDYSIQRGLGTGYVFQDSVFPLIWKLCFKMLILFSEGKGIMAVSINFSYVVSK